jgi:hypothetical protein
MPAAGFYRSKPTVGSFRPADLIPKFRVSKMTVPPEGGTVFF